MDMQQIRKLEIVGFKSFCDRTQIAFHPGVTAVVGPNGCGKSNIADAISWVVGEQSAKSLRTDRMEGVIFNGTQKRKATGFAEVTLTLSLVNPNLPEGLGLDPEDFTVGRRLYRSGESEYYLDGRRCRLKDVQMLFEGTGLGPNSYALIEQGRIGQILSSRPADRRSLIEEAARITLFKSRRYSAEMKIELAQQNLLRVNDIMREVARQLGSLRRQAAKARRYNRLREELRGIQKLKIGLEDRRLRVALEEYREKYATAQEREQSILAALADLETSRASSQQECRLKEEAVNEVHDRLAAMKLEAGDAANLRQNQKMKAESLEMRRAELDRELLAIRERQELVQKERERLEAATLTLKEEIAGGAEILQREQSRSEVLEEAIRETEGSIDEMRTFLLNRAGKLSDLKNLEVRCQENMQRIDARRLRLDGEARSAAREREGLVARLADVRRQAEAHAERIRSVSEEQRECERLSARLTEEIEQVSSDLTARQEEQSIMQHRFASLEEVEQRRSNYSEGVQKFLSARTPGEEPVPAQTLADHVETDAAYESAVEAYLNGPLQYILVGQLQDAVRSIEKVKKIGAGKCTFLTLGNGHPHAAPPPRSVVQEEGVVGYLDGLLRMNDEVRSAFERALPDYAATVMVSDLDAAFRVAQTHPECNFLTLSGEAYSPRGTLTATGSKRPMAGFLALKREKRELQKKLVQLRTKIEQARAELDRLKEEKAGADRRMKELADESRRLDIEGVHLEHETDRLESEIGKIDQVSAVTASELEQLRAEKADFEEKLAAAVSDISEIEERSRSGDEEMKELTGRLESLKIESSELSRKLSTILSGHAVKQERLAGMRSELARLAREAEDVEKKTALNGEEKSRIAEDLVSLEQAARETDLKIEELAQRIGETEESLAECRRELAAGRESLALFEEKARQLHAEREEAMGVRGRIEVEKTRLESDLDHLERSCADEFHALPEHVLADVEESEYQRDFEEVRRTYDELREKVENFGAINMRALEEYQEHEERYQFLTTQRTDIEQSIADTQKAIAEINRRSIEQFQDAFTNIRRNFTEVFQILFKGGQCDLRLLDEQDPLESGIDIVAQPPGKRLQNVLLLSGGEKALTALALLIAIFRYRPSPFCVLDEVDAPLDDANVFRYNELISELSKDTQFLLITHNKRTMQIARTLYGVTMEEAGVSKIVSVDLRRVEEPQAS